SVPQHEEARMNLRYRVELSQTEREQLTALLNGGKHGALPFYLRSNSAKVLPKRAGDGETLMPAASMAAILLSASPLPPEMLAPAWPMRRPGGAVRPAMNPTIGFLRPRLASSVRNWAASSSAEPPISPIITIASVALSAKNIASTSMNSVPLTGSPPM